MYKWYSKVMEKVEGTFHQELKKIMNEYVHEVYDITQQFPKDEIFGVTSQLRRSALSVILNYIEGYARRRRNVTLSFLEISYGSLKESKYLLYFSYKRNYLNKETYQKAENYADKIGKMLWGTLEKM